MAVDTPAVIGVIGAGPMGLETALYARFLGYDVMVFEQGDIGHHVKQWSDVQLFTPFEMNSTPLGIAAIQAQDPEFAIPDDDELLTGQEWLERYLLPLASTDLLRDHIQTETRVKSVARSHMHKGEGLGDEARFDAPLIVLTEGQGGEQAVSFDVVIDTTGVLSQPNWVGPGGQPAIGEHTLRGNRQISLGIPTRKACVSFHGQHTVVIGTGFSAATTITRLAETTDDPGTKITWISRRSSKSPITEIAEDRLSERASLAKQANQLVTDGKVSLINDATIQQIERIEEAFKLSILQGEDESPINIECDQVIANTGYRPDNSLFSELQVHLCYATDGPIKLAASLMQSESVDCLDQWTGGANTLINPEPDFYVLGSKSYGRNSNFLLQLGHQQIRDLFTIIGDRAELDLYTSAKDLIQ